MNTSKGFTRRDFIRTLGIGAIALTIPHRRLIDGAFAAPPAELATSAKDFSPAYGILPPLVTPFRENKEVDWDAYDRLIDWHIGKGVTGVFAVCGSSEYYHLKEDEAVRMARAAVARSGGAIHVLAGSTNYRHADQIGRNISMTQRMAQTGIAGCFITPPKEAPWTFYFDTEEKMLDYFTTIHDAVDCPLYAYEKPGVAYRFRFSPHFIGELGKLDRFIGIKDTATRGRLPSEQAMVPMRARLAAADGRIKILQANTKHLLASLKVGCTGGINTAANVAPGLFAKMYSLWKTGDLESAAVLQGRLNTINRTFGGGDYLPCAKAALAMMGLPILTVTRQRSRRLRQEKRQRVAEAVSLIARTEEEFEIR